MGNGARKRTSKASTNAGEHEQLLNSASAGIKFRGLFEDLPEWQQDNQYILTGYRESTNSYLDAFRSVGYLHNQTCNIYTHLLAVPILWLWAAIFFQSDDVPLTRSDYIVFGIFLAGATTCFLFSATFHTLCCHSEAMESFWVRMDFVGIIVLTVTTFLAGEYYLFYCEPIRRAMHFTLTTTIGALTIVVLLTPKFRTPRWRTFRLACFCAMGLQGFVPMVDSLVNYGWDHSMRYSIGYYLWEMALELCGAITYGMRIPERLWPGRFDIWGASHQFFHVFSAAAGVVHLVGLINAVEQTRGFERCSV